MDADVAIVGAGAAGLMAAIFAGRANPKRRILLIDSASRIGAKILISGGGRCNVTHDVVDETAFAGSTRPAIRKVLRRFEVSLTVAFFRELGVELKRENTGKLFPVSDRAQTVIDALLHAASEARVTIAPNTRVRSMIRRGEEFVLESERKELRARRVVLATGGKSVPKTGSDGQGYAFARRLGHSVTRLLPALVPLLLPAGHFLRKLSGLTTRAGFEVRSGSGKRLQSFTDSALCTHFGLSGPAVLDISRYYLDALETDPKTTLQANWIPGMTATELDDLLRTPGPGTLMSRLRGKAPENLLRAICAQCGLDSSEACSRLDRASRQMIVRHLTGMVLPITGSRGFAVAEVTAGGVPLSELHLNTMESRICPGLFLCGEICDVDGRIGGYNFQWAWSSGYVAGLSV